MDRGACWVTVHGVAKSWTWVSMHTPKTPHGGGQSSWGMSLLCSPLCQLKIKASFVFSPNSVSIFYSAFSGQRGPRFWPAAIYRILLSKNLIEKKPWKHKFASTSWEWLVKFQSLIQFRTLNSTVTYLKSHPQWPPRITLDVWTSYFLFDFQMYFSLQWPNLVVQCISERPQNRTVWSIKVKLSIV